MVVVVNPAILVAVMVYVVAVLIVVAVPEIAPVAVLKLNPVFTVRSGEMEYVIVPLPLLDKEGVRVVMDAF